MQTKMKKKRGQNCGKNHVFFFSASQVMVSMEAGTAMLFAVTPVLLYPERLIFQRFFTACSATEIVQLKTFAGNLVKVNPAPGLIV